MKRIKTKSIKSAVVALSLLAVLSSCVGGYTCPTYMQNDQNTDNFYQKYDKQPSMDLNDDKMWDSVERA